jgi:hypothetical protein
VPCLRFFATAAERRRPDAAAPAERAIVVGAAIPRRHIFVVRLRLFAIDTLTFIFRFLPRRAVSRCAHDVS